MESLLLIFLGAWGALGAPAVEARIWTDRTGEHRVEAELLSAQADTVWLRRVSDQKVFEVGLADLSPADQQHVRGLLRDRQAEAKSDPPDAAGRIAYGPPRHLAELANRAIDESSGLACSRRKPGLFWTHNDSGDAARVYLLDLQGRDLGSCELAGVERAWDWEDMASFSWRGKPYLLVGDVGNNGLSAPFQVLYLIEEPGTDAENRLLAEKVPVVQTIQFSYDDDHRDCEAVGVDPTDRTILLATKHYEAKCHIYVLPWPKNDPKATVVARRIATVDLPLVTAMDVSPDGRRAVLATYLHAHEFVRKADEDWAAAFARRARVIRLPLRVQGESICYGPDGKTLYLTSEKQPAPLWEVPVAEAPQEPAPGSSSSPE